LVSILSFISFHISSEQDVSANLLDQMSGLDCAAHMTPRVRLNGSPDSEDLECLDLVEEIQNAMNSSIAVSLVMPDFVSLSAIFVGFRLMVI
jgi:hypothetical protein